MRSLWISSSSANFLYSVILFLQKSTFHSILICLWQSPVLSLSYCIRCLTISYASTPAATDVSLGNRCPLSIGILAVKSQSVFDADVHAFTAFITDLPNRSAPLHIDIIHDIAVHIGTQNHSPSLLQDRIVFTRFVTFATGV